MTGVRCAVAVAISVAALTACGQSAVAPSPSPTPVPPNLPDALGTTGKILGNATVTTLPTSQLYVSYFQVTQPPLSTVPNGGETGFIYDVTGVHRVTTGAGQSTDVNPGDGAFVDGHTIATHVNPDTSVNTWYFVGLRPVSPPGAPFQGAQAVYGTPGLPAFGPGSYTETLRLTTIAPGGRCQAHLHGGIEVINVLKGAARFRVAGVPPAVLRAGQGTRILPGTPLQIFNDGAQDAVLLVFLITLEGVPFQTNLNVSP